MAPTSYAAPYGEHYLLTDCAFATNSQALPILHHHSLNMLTARTLERASIVIGFVRLDAIKPHEPSTLWTGRTINTRFRWIENIRTWHWHLVSLLQAGARLVSQPPTPVGRALADGGSSCAHISRGARIKNWQSASRQRDGANLVTLSRWGGMELRQILRCIKSSFNNTCSRR